MKNRVTTEDLMTKRKYMVIAQPIAKDLRNHC